jgi:transposase
MARYIRDTRDTELFVAGSLEDLLPEDSVARAIWAGLQALDFASYDALHANDEAGRSALNPRCLAGVWTLGLLRGVKSSVRLARLCARDIEYRWLMGDAPVEKSTLCGFRKEHMEALVSLSAQVLGALGQHGLLPAKDAGVDGSIVRAASSRHAVKSRRRLERRKQHLEELIRDRLVQEDSDSDSEELKAMKRWQQRVTRAVDELDARGLMADSDRLTVTEPDAGLKRQKDGSFAPGYNIQVVTDLASGAILSAEVVDAGNDAGQLQPQVQRAHAVLASLTPGEARPGIASITADSAYHDTLQVEALEQQGIQCYVPDDRDAHRTPPGVTPDYGSEAFTYEASTNTLRCPQGQTLTRRKLNNGKTATVYQASAAACSCCPAKPQCCPKTQDGRCVNRSLYTETMEAVAQRLDTDAGRDKKRARWVVCEGAFARLNELLHWRRCSMWGRTGAEMEALWRQFIHNLMLLIEVWKPMVPMRHVTG